MLRIFETLCKGVIFKTICFLNQDEKGLDRFDNISSQFHEKLSAEFPSTPGSRLDCEKINVEFSRAGKQEMREMKSCFISTSILYPSGL